MLGLRWSLNRLGQLILVAIGVTALVFLLIHLVPGDPAQAALGVHSTPEAIASLHRKWGLDLPLPQQFLLFLQRILRGDLGESLHFRQPVLEGILQRIGPTLWLVGMGSLLALAISLPLATIAATKKDKAADHLVRTIPLVGMAMPPVWVGLMLILFFSLTLRAFPVGGYGIGFYGHIRAMFLPSLTVALILAPVLIRSLRASLIDVLDSEYIATARSKGLSELQVIGRHALRNAFISTITVLGLNVGILLGTTVVVERVFALPGVGSLLVEGVLNRDFPVVQGVTFVLAIAVLFVYFATDVVLALLDPRVRSQ